MINFVTNVPFDSEFNGRTSYLLISQDVSQHTQILITEEQKVSSSRTMAFQRGDRVEVSNEEEGFVGSYYPANIIAWLSDEDYTVQYRTLVKDDDSGPLREIVSADQIRPKPPEILATGFCSSDVVDAYVNDGWWVGKIIREMGSKYLVHFENTSEKIAFPLGLLRVHQDWVNGVWVYSKK